MYLYSNVVLVFTGHEASECAGKRQGRMRGAVQERGEDGQRDGRGRKLYRRV